MYEVMLPIRILAIQEICQFYNNRTAINETIIKTLYWKLSVYKLVSVGIKDQFLKNLLISEAKHVACSFVQTDTSYRR